MIELLAILTGSIGSQAALAGPSDTVPIPPLGLEPGHILVMILLGAIGCLTVVLLIPMLCRRMADKQGGGEAREFHHTHRAPVPRLGGVALAAGFAVVALTAILVFSTSWEQTRTSFVVVGGALAMFGIGLWDDLQPLGARRKLVAQILIALAVYGLGLRIDMVSNPLAGGQISLGGWGALATVVWLVAITNLINLIDGTDGLAGGICLMLMGLLVYVQHTQDALPLLACGMVGCLIGFLYFNFPPAKIYLGDGGAYFLGFLIGELTIVSSHKGTVAAALIAPLFVLALPILDVSLAILRRGLRGLPLFRPDRSHIHHHLLDMGLSRRSAVLGMYCFTLIFLVLGFAAFGLQNRWLPVLAGTGILVILLAAGKLSFSREWFAVGHVVGNSLRMREEITYTLSLTNWLVQEARRVDSVEEFWSLFTFAAERLGFAEVRVSLADGERKWSRVYDSQLELLEAEHDFQTSGAGFLIFKAERKSPDSAESGRIESCIGDARAFHVVSELLAEAWLKASRQLRPSQGVPLRFGSSVTSIGETPPQRTVATLPSRLSDTARL